MMYMNFSSSNGSYTDGLTDNLDQQMYIPPVGVSDFNTSQEVLLNFGGSHDFSSWRDGRNDMVMMSPVEGLSLSLGTNVPPEMQMPHQYQNAENNFSVAVLESRYLKTVQELLDEVVNVKEDMNEQKNAKKELMKEYFKEIDRKLTNERPSHPSLVLNEEATGESSTEVAVAEKQELQNKMTKLLSMMEEVDRQYKQYYHQMQVLVSSFDMVAGSGSAKPYTSLTLQTISRHFRCLRDAINSQIHVTKKNLGEEYTFSNEKRIGISRLRYVDQKLRQQRVLQHLGMNTWRPQRGLPETSVSILRAWLFKHFLHPYPKDSDKILLARKTGLTRSQVSNWFINARVRLWKPMVEEMYKEEVGDTEMDSNSSSETIPTDTKEAYEDQGEDLGHGGTSKEHLVKSKFDNMPMMEYENNPSFHNLLQSDPQSDKFMYNVSELERFGNRNEVLLTLGLQSEAEAGFETWAGKMQFF